MSDKNHLHFYMDLLRHVSYQEDPYGLYNLLNTFRIARNGVICGETFDDLDFGNIPLNELKFQRKGEVASTFQRTSLGQFSFMAGHAGEIRCATFSPSGKYLLTASQDHSVILWDTESGLMVQKLDGHEDAVLAAVFSPSCLYEDADDAKSQELRYCLTGSRDATAILWCLDSGEICYRFEMHTKDVEHVAFSMDGTKCLTGSRDGSIMMWDTQTGTPCYPHLIRHQAEVTGLGFSPDGWHFFSCSRDGMIHLWNVADGSLACSIDIHQKSVNQLLVSPQKGEYLLSASDDGTAVLYDIFDLSKRHVRHTFEHPNEAVKVIAYSQNEKFIATGTDKGNVYLWAADSGERILDLKEHKHTISNVYFSEDCKYCIVASISEEEPVVIYEVNLNAAKPTDTQKDIKTARPLHWFHLHKKPVTAIGFSRDGKFCFTASEDHTAAIWFPQTGKLHHHLKSHIGPINGVAISSDKSSLLTASNGTVILWDKKPTTLMQHKKVFIARFHKKTFTLHPRKKTFTAKLPKKPYTVKQQMKIMTNHFCLLTFSPNNSQILISTIDPNHTSGVTGNVKVISLTKDAATFSFNIHQNSENMIHFSQSSEYLLAADNTSKRNTLSLYQTKSGKKMKVQTDPESERKLSLELPYKILTVAMSPDERYILIGGNDGTAALWELERIDDETVSLTFQRNLLPMHNRAVKAIAFSHNSKQCLLNLGDSAVVLWDIEEGRELKRITGYPQQVATVAFSADDSCFLIGLEKGIVVKHCPNSFSFDTAEQYDTHRRTCDIPVMEDDDEDRTAAYSDDGKPILFFNASSDGETCYAANLENQGFLWDVKDLTTPIGICPGTGKSAITFSADGQYCLVGRNDGVAQLWNMQNGTLTTELYHISDLFVSDCPFHHINASNNVLKILHQYHADIQIAQPAAQKTFILPSD